MLDLVSVGGVVSSGTLVPCGEDECLVPLGTCVATWNAVIKKRVSCSEVHRDTVTCIGARGLGPGTPSGTPLIATGSFLGEIALLVPAADAENDDGSKGSWRVVTGLTLRNADGAAAAAGAAATPRAPRRRAVDAVRFSPGGRAVMTLSRCYRQHSIGARRGDENVTRDAHVDLWRIASGESGACDRGGAVDGGGDLGDLGTLERSWSLTLEAFGAVFAPSAQAEGRVGPKAWIVVAADVDEDAEADIVGAGDVQETTHVGLGPSLPRGDAGGEKRGHAPRQCLVSVDPSTGRVAKLLRVPGGRITALAGHPRSARTLVCRADGAAAMLDVAADGAFSVLWSTAPDVTGCARLRCCAISPDGSLIAVPGRGRLVALDAADGSLRGEHPCLSGATRGLAFAPSGRAIWSAGEFAISRHALTDTAAASLDPIMRHDLSACGVAIEPVSGSLVAVGDLGGSVTVYTVPPSARPSRDPPSATVRCPTSTSVRTVTFAPDGRSVQFGSLDGTLWTAPILAAPSPAAATASAIIGEPRLVCEARGSITSLHWSPLRNVLAAGTISGEVVVLLAPAAHHPASSLADGSRRRVTTACHEPGQEVWSVCFSPCGSALATASEDTTTAVWRIAQDGSLERRAVLEGHSAAVTCNDWSARPGGGTVLVTSSDDRTVRVYFASQGDPTDSLQLRHVFATTDYLITYVALEDCGSRLAGVTEDGFRYLWDLVGMRQVDRRKVHSGSIEGLAWHRESGTIACCASDCTVTIARIAPVTHTNPQLPAQVRPRCGSGATTDGDVVGGSGGSGDAVGGVGGGTHTGVKVVLGGRG